MSIMSNPQSEQAETSGPGSGYDQCQSMTLNLCLDLSLGEQLSRLSKSDDHQQRIEAVAGNTLNYHHEHFDGPE